MLSVILPSYNEEKMIPVAARTLSEVLDEAGIEHETVEDGETFMDNARKKAREIMELSGCCALADDSGLCVDALDGAPGLYSARFSGRHGDDAANNRLLLEKLQGVQDRSAHYTCAMALYRPDGSCVDPKRKINSIESYAIDLDSFLLENNISRRGGNEEQSFFTMIFYRPVSRSS